MTTHKISNTISTYTWEEDDETYTLYTAGFQKDYSTFFTVMQVPKGVNANFFSEFLRNFDLGGYSNSLAAVDLTAEYNGSADPGTTISHGDPDLVVTVEYENGEKEQATYYDMDDDIEIVAGETRTANIACHGLTCELSVTGRKVVDIEAKYSGSTEEGTTISKSNIKVTATYDDGKTGSVNINSCGMGGDTTLQAGKTSIVTIKYGDLTYELEIACTTKTVGQENAVRMAESYLRSNAFSRTGLIKQLEFEGFSTEEAEYAVDNCSADWKEQAVKCAKSYLRSQAFSKNGLYDQLIFEGFTEEQAQYGVDEAYQ